MGGKGQEERREATVRVQPEGEAMREAAHALASKTGATAARGGSQVRSPVQSDSAPSG